jgi:hypothetical protein
MSSLTFCAFPEPPFGEPVVVKVIEGRMIERGEFEVPAAIWLGLARALQSVPGVQVKEFPALK